MLTVPSGYTAPGELLREDSAYGQSYMPRGAFVSMVTIIRAGILKFLGSISSHIVDYVNQT